MSGTEDLEIVERVGNKMSKKTKLDVYTPSDPIKTTHEPHSSNMSNNFSKQQDASPCPDKKARSHSRDGWASGRKLTPQ